MRHGGALSILLCVAQAACAQPRVDSHAPAAGSAGYLARAHSHNDYQGVRPLMDALGRGFASVEVDIVLRDGELYVAHEEEELDPALTLTGLYLDPLRALVRRSGRGVYATSEASLQLLVDVKTEADATYRALDEVLGEYGDLLTRWTPEGPRPGPVTAVISGNRALRAIQADTLRYVAIDGRVEDDRSAWSLDEMPLVSIDWEELGASGTAGRLAAARALVTQLQREGRKVRFWGTLDEEAVWRSLLEIGVDYIGTDDAEGLERMLRSTGHAP